MSFKALVEMLAGRPLLTRKDLARRYGVTTKCIDDWHRRATLPAPIYLKGCLIPLWRPMDIHNAEKRNRTLSKHYGKQPQS